MNTRDSQGFQGLFAAALESGSNLTEKDREGALKAWITRHANEGFAEAERAKALRAAGDEQGARVAERNVDRAARKLNEKLQNLQAHVGRQVNLHDVVGRRLAGAFEGKIKVAPPGEKKPEPQIIDTAWRQGVRPPKAPDPKGPEAVDLLARMGLRKRPADTDPGNKAEAELAARQAAEEKKPEPEKPKPPVERKHEGQWDDIRQKHAEARQKLHEQGFKRVDVEPMHEQGGKHVAREILEHDDGRKVEHHVEFDPESGKASLRTVEHAAPPGPKAVFGEGPEIVGGWKAHGSHAGSGNLALAHEHAALNFVAALPKEKDALKARMKLSPMQGAIGETYFVKDEHGNNAGVWKHILDDRMFGGVKEQYRELANYRVAQSMGFSVAPPVVPFDQKMPSGKAGSHFMVFVKDAQVAHNVEKPHQAVKDLNSLQQLIALDVIMGQTDRHYNNWMITKDGKAVGIDSGFAFARGEEVGFHGIRGAGSPKDVLDAKGKTDKSVYKITPELKAKLKTMKPEHLDKILKPLGLRPRVIEATKSRLKVLQNMTELTDENFRATRRNLGIGE